MELADLLISPIQRRQGTEGSEQREGWVCGFHGNDFSLLTSYTQDFFVLGYITKSTVMICPSVKICEFFFFPIFSLLACPLCPSHYGVVSGKKKRHRSDIRVRRVLLVLVSDTCRTLVLCQKWRVDATQQVHWHLAIQA